MVDLDEIAERFCLSENGTLAYRGKVKGRRSDGVVGHTRNDGYVRVNVRGRSLFAHKIVYFLAFGTWPEIVDHINGNRSDNHPDNLRECTPTQNQANMKTSSRNRSGVKGVSWHRATSRWYASIQKSGKSHNLGYFDKIEDAASAYKRAAEQHFGEFARLA